MSGAEEEFNWLPSGAESSTGRGSDRRMHGARWVISLRALVVVLAMMAAALGVLWVESAGVQDASAELATQEAVKVVVPPLEGAPTKPLNLAAPLTDGLQVLVPTKEQAATMVPGPGSGQSPGQQGALGGGPAGPKPLINLNKATATDLDALPGVGPVLAERIVLWRTEHGPYPSVDALDAVSGIGAKLLAGLRDLVTVS